MANRRPVLPDVVRCYRLQVVRATDVGPSFRRVTATSDALREFQHLGFDHWFRLFVPAAGQQSWRLPTATSKFWYAQWLATPAKERPHVNNYTVRAFRPDSLELDIDVVLHRGAGGRLEGRVAQWATEVQPGDELAILDEGLLFNRPPDTRSVLLTGDESALPALEGVLASLPDELGGRAVVEVPTPGDVRDLAHGPAVEVQWVVRSEVAADGVPGAAALAAVCAGPAPAADTYAFLVGASGLATGARRHLVRAGLAKDRITFCGYWKSSVRQRQAVGTH